MADCGSAARYEIGVYGLIDPAWFPEAHVSGDDGRSAISADLPDQSALFGLLTRIRDLGLCLVSLRRLELNHSDRSANRRVEGGPSAPHPRTQHTRRTVPRDRVDEQSGNARWP
jgi:hypothetical protein